MASFVSEFLPRLQVADEILPWSKHLVDRLNRRLLAINAGSAVDHNGLSNLTVGDVHTHYVNKNGRAGGQTISGDLTGAGSLSLKPGAYSTFSPADSGRINLLGFTKILPGTIVEGAASAIRVMIECDSTVAMNPGVALATYFGYWFHPTFTYNTALSVLNTAPAFFANPTYAPTGAITDAGIVQGFDSQPIYAPNGVTCTLAHLAGMVARPRSIPINSGVANFTLLTAYTTWPQIVFGGNDLRGNGTTTLAVHYHVKEFTKDAGHTVSAQIGFDCPKFTLGGFHAGIRNADCTIFTSSTVQTVTAGGTITVDATVVKIQSTGNVTMTATPIIADGQDGQVVTIVNVDSTDTVTLTNGTTNNLRLAGAANLALGPLDAVTLMFVSAIGDWVQVGASNN